MNSNNQQLKPALQKLYNSYRTSEKKLHAASEQMQNPGLKALFKRFTQQHKQFGSQLESLVGQLGFSLSTPGRFRDSLQRGWMDIRIAMIVGRANRQEAAAAQSAESTDALLQTYAQVLAQPLPEFVADIIQAQQSQVERIYQWLQRIKAPEQWIVRLYDNPANAEQAVAELKGSGFAESQIKITPLNQIAIYTDDAEEQAHSTADATLAGGVLGAAISLIAGLVIGLAVPLFDPSVAESQPALWLSTLSWGLIWGIAGGTIGAFFGFLLGQGLSEDDASLAQDLSYKEGIVVSVQTTESNYTDAAEILEMWHEREGAEVPA